MLMWTDFFLISTLLLFGSFIGVCRAYNGFSAAPLETGNECLLDTRRNRASNRLQLAGQIFGRDGSEGFVSAVFSGPSTRGMNESRTEIKIVFGEMIINGSSILLEHSQKLFSPSDIVSTSTYPRFTGDKEYRDYLNVYITFSSHVLEENDIDLVPGRFYFLEASFGNHYKYVSHRCYRLDVVYTSQDVTYVGDMYYNVKSFGAVGDGQNDDTASLQTAINTAAVVGGTVYIPPGHYRTSSTLTIPAGVSIVGAGLGANPRDMSDMKGTIILYRGYDFALVLQGDLIEIKNLVVYDNGNHVSDLRMI